MESDSAVQVDIDIHYIWLCHICTQSAFPCRFRGCNFVHVLLFLQIQDPEVAAKIDKFMEKMKKLLLLETPFELVRN